MEMVNGAPIPLLNCVGLLGSMTLLAGAILAPFRSKAEAKCVLTGSLLSWTFYGPLVVVGFLMPYTSWSELRTFISFREYVPLVGTIMGPILLIACTVASIRSLKPRVET